MSNNKRPYSSVQEESNHYYNNTNNSEIKNVERLTEEGQYDNRPKKKVIFQIAQNDVNPIQISDSSHHSYESAQKGMNSSEDMPLVVIDDDYNEEEEKEFDEVLRQFVEDIEKGYIRDNVRANDSSEKSVKQGDAGKCLCVLLYM